MAKEQDKKTLLVLLVALGLVLIACGWWLFGILKPQTKTADPIQDMQIQKIFSLKEVALDNIEKFLGLPGKPNSIFEDFYSDPQYKSLKELKIDIDISEGIGNDYPFASSTPSVQ